MDVIQSQDPHPPSPLRTKWWIALAVGLYLMQVLPYLSYRWVTDESWYSAPGYSIATGQGVKDPAIGPNDLEHDFDARPPGTALVIASGFRMFGVNQVAARLGSVCAGLLIVLLTYRVATSFLGHMGGVVAMLLVATDNLIVLTARTARPEALTVFCVMLGMLAMGRYCRGPSLVWPVLSGLFLALGTMFHITLLGYVISLGLIALAKDRSDKRFFLRGFLSYGCGYLAGLAPFAFWILRSPLGRAGFRSEYLGRAKTPLAVKLQGEATRYHDVLGLNLLHGHGLSALPLRLPIPLLFCAALFLLWRYRRDWFRVALVLWIPTSLWLIYTVNKSSRYVALLAPVFALAIGAALVATRQRRRIFRAVSVWATLVIVGQLGANLLLLSQFRRANYPLMTQELQSVIPVGQTAYGTMTFWLALHDHPFISYERTTPQEAAERFHARYFILGDRMMTQGGGSDEAFYTLLNAQFTELTAHCSFVAEFPDPYYGDIKVFKLPD